MFFINEFYDRYPASCRATPAEIAEYEARPEVIADRAARAEIDKQAKDERLVRLARQRIEGDLVRGLGMIEAALARAK